MIRHAIEINDAIRKMGKREAWSTPAIDFTSAGPTPPASNRPHWQDRDKPIAHGHGHSAVNWLRKTEIVNIVDFLAEIE
uniref:CRIB domain-containing protein n=1 Tax=Panagrellus redivivus TaxID=6233 RepID=A0A7E4UPC4_PANRE